MDQDPLSSLKLEAWSLGLIKIWAFNHRLNFHIFTPILRRVNISKFFILSWCSIKSFQMLFKSIKTTHRKIREIITLNTTSQLKNLFKKVSIIFIHNNPYALTIERI